MNPYAPPSASASPSPPHHEDPSQRFPAELKRCRWIYFLLGALSVAVGVVFLERDATFASIVLALGLIYGLLGLAVRKYPRATSMTGVVLCALSILSQLVPPYNSRSIAIGVMIQAWLLLGFWRGWTAAARIASHEQ